jgi:hypothetical protein
MKIISLRTSRCWLWVGAGAIILIGLLYWALNQAAQPEPKWQADESWQVHVEQRADHLMTYDPPWITVNNLEMKLSQTSNHPDGSWCVNVWDQEGRELFPGVQALQIDYSADFDLLGGRALSAENEPVFEIQEFWAYSLYGPDFFEVTPKTSSIQGLWSDEPQTIILNKSAGRSSTWEKGKVWWKEYQSAHPPIRANLVQE